MRENAECAVNIVTEEDSERQTEDEIIETPTKICFILVSL